MPVSNDENKPKRRGRPRKEDKPEETTPENSASTAPAVETPATPTKTDLLAKSILENTPEPGAQAEHAPQRFQPAPRKEPVFTVDRPIIIIYPLPMTYTFLLLKSTYLA